MHKKKLIMVARGYNNNLANSFSTVALTMCDIFIVEILVTWPENDR